MNGRIHDQQRKPVQHECAEPVLKWRSLLWLFQQILHGENQEKEPGRTATQHVFCLLPQIGPLLEFREIRLDQRCSRDNAARNIGCVCSIESVGCGYGGCTDAGGKGNTVSRMTAQHKIKGAAGELRGERGPGKPW